MNKLDVFLAGIRNKNYERLDWIRTLLCLVAEPEGKKVRESATLTEEFWKPIFEDTDFKKYCSAMFAIEKTDGFEHVEIPNDSDEEILTSEEEE
jgi:hypothetical protein